MENHFVYEKRRLDDEMKRNDLLWENVIHP